MAIVRTNEQGEANAGDPKSYACRFPAMIADWRAKFGLPDLSFFFVQLAPYWPRRDFTAVRNAQMAALKLPRTGYAVRKTPFWRHSYA